MNRPRQALGSIRGPRSPHRTAPLLAALVVAATAISILTATAAAQRAPALPTELPGLAFTNAFVEGATYRTDIPTVDQLLGFQAGTRAATSAEVLRCLQAWTNAAPDRCRLVEYARSHEDRPLHLFFITAPAHLAALEDIRARNERIADPRQTNSAALTSLLDTTPSVAWLSATIHGDETEGSDAMLVVAHHLLAAQGEDVARLLQRLVVVVDPVMNPDGRDRFLKMIAEHRGTAPNVDEQSLLHSGYWPWGRGNHYLFDLNRDWLFGVHPETRGRMREVARWNPILFVDAHGMGAQDTHLFGPSREPRNPHLPEHRHRWAERFGADQARAFDRQGLVFYNGEWAEEWFPGYSDAWASYRGAVGILYEQARIAADGVRRPEGRILSYRESVWHHVIGALANLQTTATHAREMMSDLRAARVRALDPEGPYARRTFAILPTANDSRLRSFVELMHLHGLEVYRLPRAATAPSAVDGLGREQKDAALPAGTVLIPNRQPLGHLAAAILEFDPRFTEAVLQDERREILRTGDSRMYDTTSWSLCHLLGLPALSLACDLPEGAEPLPRTEPSPGSLRGIEAPLAWVFDGADDLSTAAAARLMERGVQVRAALRPFNFDQRSFERGSILVLRLDNRTFPGELDTAVRTTAQELGLDAVGIGSGLGAGDLPDLGGSHFARLEPPRVALAGREGTANTDFGAVWHTLDHRLGIRSSQINRLEVGDLGRYNVIILPQGPSEPGIADQLKDWIHRGGTLIAIGQATSPFTREAAGLGQVRQLPDVLDKLPDYELAVLREWLTRSAPLPAAGALWGHSPPSNVEYPWPAAAYPDEKELKRRDAWQIPFMPAGALLATRIDTNHWITAGCTEPLPVLADRGPVQMAATGTPAPIRYGLLSALPPQPPSAGAAPQPPSASTPAPSGDTNKDAKPEVPRPGWTSLPTNTVLHLRMGGLLWPEASHRLANSAWVTCEPIGRGQLILFATSPVFRGGAPGMMRVFLNAVVVGPGVGAQHSLRP